MNRYIFEGIVNELHKGKRVVIVTPTTRQSSFVFRDVADALSDDHAVAQIRRANGQESITTHTGGYLTFIAVNMHGGRGFNADVLIAFDMHLMPVTGVRDIREYAAFTRAELIQA